MEPMPRIAQEPAFVGIDVSKERLDAHARPSGAARCLPHDAAGLKALLRWLLALAPTLVVVEATGGLERRLARALSAAGLAVAVVNPRQARRFAQALGLLAKTDRIDARGLALYGERIRPEPRAQPSPELERLAALVARRRQLIDLGVQERNRRGQAADPLVRRQIDATLALIARQRVEVEAALGAAIAADPAWGARRALIQSMPGAGAGLAQLLIAQLPELGGLGRRQIASLAGLAPHPRDSGRRHRHRSIGGGRGALRAVLYMAALSAIRCNPLYRQLHQRLRGRGKPAKLALVAVMRHMLVALNAMLRDHRPWQPATHPA
jgi:transposase